MKDNFNEFIGMGMTSERSRDNLIETLKQKGIKNNEVLKIMKKIPRHILLMKQSLTKRMIILLYQ